MTISVIQSTGGTADNTTSIAKATGSNITNGNRLVVILHKYSPSADAPILGDISQSAGTATLGSFAMDCVVSYNFNGTEYLHIAIYSAPITGSGSCTITVGGGVAGCFWIIGLAEINSTEGSITFENASTASNATGAPDSGNVSSAGPAIFIGGVGTVTGGATTHTPDAAFTQIFEEEDGANHLTGSNIYRIVGTSTTDSASWTAPTTVKWVAGLAVYKEPIRTPVSEFVQVDESYEAEQDYNGWVAWQIPLDILALPWSELPQVDESYEEEQDYSGYVAWQTPLDVIDFQSLAELPQVDETYEEEQDYSGYVAWQTPLDVIDFQSLAELPQVDESYEEEQDYSGYVAWQTPLDAIDFQSLAELPQVDESYDESYTDNFDGFTFWLIPDDIQDPLLGIIDLPQVDESYELVEEYFGWLWSGNIEDLTALNPGAVIIGKRQHQLHGTDIEQVSGIPTEQTRGVSIKQVKGKKTRNL